MNEQRSSLRLYAIRQILKYTNMLKNLAIGSAFVLGGSNQVYGDVWGGLRPDDRGPYANGQPVSLMVVSIEDYKSRNDIRDNYPQVNLTSTDIAEIWKKQADPARGIPRVDTFLDGAVSSSLFTGTGAPCTQYDMVIFSGHGGKDGPWMGKLEDSYYMQPVFYDWSSGITKWFVNKSCSGLADGLTNGPMDENFVISQWGRVMGLNSPYPNRLHSYLSYRSRSFAAFDREFSGGLPGGHGWTSGMYTCNAQRIFVNILMHSDNECKDAKYPKTIGENWFIANAKQWAMYATKGGIAPAILNWYAVKETGGAPIIYDYFLESFHAPFPGPGTLGPEFSIKLKAHSQNYGKPNFDFD